MADLLILIVVVAAAADLVRRSMHNIDSWQSWPWTVDAFLIGAAGGVAASDGGAEAFARGVGYGAVVAFVATLSAWIFLGHNPEH